MTYHRPLFTANVLKVRLSCVKPSEKTGGKNQQKNNGKGKKNQDRGRIYTPGYTSKEAPGESLIIKKNLFCKILRNAEKSHFLPFCPFLYKE